MPQQQTLKGSLREKPARLFWRTAFTVVDEDPIKAVDQTNELLHAYIDHFTRNQSDETRRYIIDEIKENAPILAFQPFEMKWISSVSANLVILCYKIKPSVEETPKTTGQLKDNVNIETIFALS